MAETSTLKHPAAQATPGGVAIGASVIFVRYIEHSGRERRVGVETGQTVMSAAASSGVHGIDAECGGSCACATCHVYVDESWFAEVGPPAGVEADLLEFVARRRPNSRLACQIALTDRLDGLIVRVPETQKA